MSGPHDDTVTCEIRHSGGYYPELYRERKNYDNSR